MRDHFTEEEMAAALLLDAVKFGLFDIPEADILRALWVLGDAVGVVA